MSKFNLSQRRACQIFDQHRSTHRYEKNSGEFDELVRTRVIEIARDLILTTKEFIESGHKKVSKYLQNSPRDQDCGLIMGVVFVTNLLFPIMFGVMTLSHVEQRMEGVSRFSM